MARSITLWIVAVVVTLASAYYQRVTGPSYPVDGTTEFAGTNIEYSLTRSHGGEGDQEVAIIVPNAKIWGRAVYRRYPTEEPWEIVACRRAGDRLVAALPHQPASGKLEYFFAVYHGNERLTIPDDRTVITRFRGDVPALVLIPHIIVIFMAMLLSMRAGLESMFSDGECRGHTLWAFGLFVIGGLILGPLVQKYAFGEYWTGVPFGYDLTDNKTLIAVVAWFIAVLGVWNRGYRSMHPGRRWLAFAASLVTLAIFLIPHSFLGSQYDYQAMKPAIGAMLRFVHPFFALLPVL